MEWLRWKHGTVSDARLTLVQRASSLPRYLVIAAYAAVKEYASGQRDRGSLGGFSAKLLAATVECEVSEAVAFLKACEAEGVLSRAHDGEAGRVLGWEEEQGTDPGAADRMRAFRARKREKAAGNGPVTGRNALRGVRNGSDDDAGDLGGTSGKRPPEKRKGPRKQADAEPRRNGRNALRLLPREIEREKDREITPHTPPQGGLREVETGFAAFYEAYPRKVGRDAAERAYRSALRRATAAGIADGLEAAKAEWSRKATPKDLIPHPSTWLNGGRWADEHQDPAAADDALLREAEEGERRGREAWERKQRELREAGRAFH